MVDLSPSETISRADNMTLVGVLLSGIGGMIYAVGAGAIDVIYAIFGTMAIPLDALGISLGDWVSALFSGPATFLGAAFDAASASIAPGGTFHVGPFTPLLVIAIVLGFFWLIAQYLEQTSTGDTIVGFTTDLPLIGSDEEEG